jgi:hypothetical protein
MKHERAQPISGIIPVQKRFCHFAVAWGSLSPPHPWLSHLENSEPEFPTNVDIEQKQVPMQSKSPFQTDFGQQCSGMCVEKKGVIERHKKSTNSAAGTPTGESQFYPTRAVHWKEAFAGNLAAGLHPLQPFAQTLLT